MAFHFCDLPQKTYNPDLIIRWTFSSVTQSCPTLCDPMNHSTPGLPVHHQLLEFTQNSCSSRRWCHPAISSSVIPFSSCPQSLPAPGSFPMSQLFAWGGQGTRVSASASVLPMNIQDWSPLGWMGWVSLQSKGLSRVFSNTTVQKHQVNIRHTQTEVHSTKYLTSAPHNCQSSNKLKSQQPSELAKEIWWQHTMWYPGLAWKNEQRIIWEL